MPRHNVQATLALLYASIPSYLSVRVAIILVLLAIVLLTATIKAYASYRETRRYSKLFGCQPPPLDNSYDPLGLRKIIRSTRTFFKKESLYSVARLFAQHGNTYRSRVLTSMVIFTCDPRNIKQILANRFQDFESSPLRGHLFKPLLAHSIFQLDGTAWKITRDVYRQEGRFSNLRKLCILTLIYFSSYIQASRLGFLLFTRIKSCYPWASCFSTQCFKTTR